MSARAGTAFALAVAIAVAPASTHAGPYLPSGLGARCTLNPSTRALEVVIEPDPTDAAGTDRGAVTLIPRDKAIDVVGGDGSFDVTCAGGTPTRTNVDTINVVTDPSVGEASLRLVEFAREFAPGVTEEVEGPSEIEIGATLGTEGSVLVYKGKGPDSVTAGVVGDYRALNLNAAEPAPDADVFTDGVFLVDGGPGADRLSAAAGLGGFEDPLDRLGPPGLVMLGSGGDDRMRGGATRDVLIGQGGRDSYAAGGGTDLVVSADRNGETVRCGPGSDRFDSDRRDRVRGCESRAS